MTKIKKNEKIKIPKKKITIQNKKSVKNNISNDLEKYTEMVQRSIISVQKYKSLDIITGNELNISLQNLENVFENISSCKKKKKFDIAEINKIKTEIYNIFRLFGTKKISDIIYICFGNNYLTKLNNNEQYKLIKKYIHPINFKLLDWNKNNHKKSDKYLARNKIVEDFMIVETSDTLDCFDLARTSNHFHTKVYGIKISFQCPILKKTLIISGIMDDVIIQCIYNPFIKLKLDQMKNNIPCDVDFDIKDYNIFISCLTLKELLIYNEEELFKKFIGYSNQIKLIKQKTISQIVKEFISSDLYTQRKTLIQLLIKNYDPEFQYLAYLLYDLLSNDTNGNVDTFEQTLLFDSLPWNIKKFFRVAMKTTIKYTKNLSNFDTNKIPIEQQICLMKANDNIKEKAMNKLKEVKAKNEDSGSKARQYLEGLLKIPFGIIKKEKILTELKNMNAIFKKIIISLNNNNSNETLDIPSKKFYTTGELQKHINYIENSYFLNINNNKVNELILLINSKSRNELIVSICYINTLLKKYDGKHKKICHSGKKMNYMKKAIEKTIKLFETNTEIMNCLFKKYKIDYSYELDKNILSDIQLIKTSQKYINNNLTNVNKILEESVHGHKKAKRQIERIIGQWITGKQSGYCFGFEGPPGVGKTSLARKGLSKCLICDGDKSRPFSFIALGGSSNGSTLAGHSYTYVGSTWGRIVDILMETKCMNPIIFIDELDKVSKTEQGKEIIGILTHLIDSTQNESFQDKYFSGIELNLSNALFIFSYNDPASIDKILLDRIHRVKFDNLTLFDKLKIAKSYLIPEINSTIGIDNIVSFSDNVLKYIINNYTYESGVRKLKQILYEIVSEINLIVLERNDIELSIPIILTEDDIKYVYLKDRHEIIHKKIPDASKVGLINGLWANALGMGGIIPIEISFFPSKTFLEFKLTGLQGDVMKESMNVAKTLAWKLTKTNTQKKLIKNFEKLNLQGVHIHCPEGSVPKDGPSAGTAITIALYSLFNDKKIKNTIAITGEINLQGSVTAIGGLDLKILGGIRDGVTHFIYPKSNEKDFKKFFEKKENKENIDTNKIQFTSVSNISEVLKIVFEK
jgi:ATP-dependent Lon protease